MKRSHSTMNGYQPGMMPVPGVPQQPSQPPQSYPAQGEDQTQKRARSNNESILSKASTRWAHGFFFRGAVGSVLTAQLMLFYLTASNTGVLYAEL